MMNETNLIHYEFFLVGWLIELYGISTIVANLNPKPGYTYILNIYDL